VLIAGPSSTAAKIPTHRANGYELIARAGGWRQTRRQLAERSVDDAPPARL